MPAQVLAALAQTDCRPGPRLSLPPANRLEKLKGDLVGFHSIRINAQYRVTFRFVSGDAHDVAVIDYH